MGTNSSKQKLGERVLDARKELAAVKKVQSERTQRIESASRETLDLMVNSIERAFGSCSPFSEQMLLVAFEADPEQVQRILSKSCKKVLSAPIVKAEWDWFLQYVFPSMIWMMKVCCFRCITR